MNTQLVVHTALVSNIVVQLDPIGYTLHQGYFIKSTI